MKTGTGSKLLLSLLIQGSIIGAAYLYKKVKDEDKTGSENDLDSSIDRMTEEDNLKAQAKKQADESSNSTNGQKNKTEELKDNLLKDIENFTKKSQETLNIIAKPLGVLESIINDLSGVKNKTKPSNEDDSKKEETVSQPKPSYTMEDPPEHNNTRVNQAPIPTEEKVQPKPEKVSETVKPKNTHEASNSVNTPEKQPVRSVHEISQDLLTKINNFKKPVEQENTETVIKNKVDLPKPALKTVKKATQKPTQQEKTESESSTFSKPYKRKPKPAVRTPKATNKGSDKNSN